MDCKYGMNQKRALTQQQNVKTCRELEATDGSVIYHRCNKSTEIPCIYFGDEKHIVI